MKTSHEGHHPIVVVPDAVASELSAAGAPPTVRDWILQPPSWVPVVPVAVEAVETIADDLDLGERSAIALAATLGADLLLIDEAAGRAGGKTAGICA